MYHFCTITTSDHFHKVMALYDSVTSQADGANMHVLCIDDLPADLPAGNITFYTLKDLAGYPVAKRIISKYQSPDKIRWSLKPVFLQFLLENKTEKVIYADNDIYFYGSYIFLFDLLDQYDFLLTPHNYPRDPNKNQNWLEANFRVGLYNAGFIGVHKSAVSIVKWWAECCAYRCEKNALRGTFDDQKYLDLIPIMDEKAYIVRHPGCNVAEWNSENIKRSMINDKVILNDQYPLIFIHFNGTTVRAISDGEEPALETSLTAYLNNLKKYKPTITSSDLYKSEGILDKIKYSIWRIATSCGL